MLAINKMLNLLGTEFAYYLNLITNKTVIFQMYLQASIWKQQKN